ncbi:LysR family transcriptional regulator [Herbaspirillum sp. B65]|uniref:LysR family transcriptional regulator n=1 Tax=Herbaspirillum sp. B65 TaxID=137708 RepID=UPI0020900DAB|nr:LysR family transcriptional regulator [Herbaspirillum sp. B65]
MHITMDLRQLQQFVVLAETLNFREAAERLFMSQPPLSVSIKKLEDEIGVALFNRNKHKVFLTDAGKAVLEDARKSLFHAGEVSRVARSAALGLSGHIRIGFVGSAKYSLLPRLLPKFRSQYPDVTIALEEEKNALIVQAIENNDLDLGIVRVPLAWKSVIQYETVEQDYFVAALPSDHRLAKKLQLSLIDLKDESFIQYTRSNIPGLHAVTMLLFQEAGFVPKVTQEAVQVETLLCMVESGLGVALVPSIVRRHSSRNITFREISGLKESNTIGLAIAYHPDFEMATSRRFRELARELSMDSASSY